LHKVTQAAEKSEISPRAKVSLSYELGDTRSVHKLIPISPSSTLVVLEPETANKNGGVGEMKFVSDAELLGVKKGSAEKSDDMHS
jgi:hypothetical protein